MESINLGYITMSLIRTVSVSSSSWSNQLSRLFFLPPRFSGELNFRLLQFQRMDSFSSSANRHILPVAKFDGSSSGDNEELLHNRDNSDGIMVGTIYVSLKGMGRNQNSSSSSSVHKGDNLKLGVQEGASANSPNSEHEEDFPPLFKHGNKRKKIDLTGGRGLKNNSGRSRSNNTLSSQLERSSILGSFCQRDESSVQNRWEKKKELSYLQKCHSGDFSSKNSIVTEKSPPFLPFSICCLRKGQAKSKGFWPGKGTDALNISEHVAKGANNRVLRPGMVLLKHYITLQEQVNIVKICQKLGIGPGGFYRPGYKDGPKLSLQMMCLGLDWDPQTRKYGDKRAIDGVKPPDIPPEFAKLVEKTLQEAHAVIKNQTCASNIEGILPSMSPNICIVNFYTTSGKLGLHQDRDESKQSLTRGLPVVSFSVGNSAEFMYGDRRDKDKAEKVVLESGDVLIFGGESRHIFHGVSSIIPNSAPKILLEYTGLRPGRLNLTFREY